MYREIPADEFREATRDPSNRRFGYSVNRMLHLVLLALVGGMWVYIAVTVLRATELSISVYVFVAVFVVVTVVVFTRIRAWRRFVSRSAVVMTPRGLLWMREGVAHSLDWSDVDKDRMQIVVPDKATRRTEGSITFDFDSGTAEIIVLTPFARLNNFEVLLSEILMKMKG